VLKEFRDLKALNKKRTSKSKKHTMNILGRLALDGTGNNSAPGPPLPVVSTMLMYKGAQALTSEFTYNINGGISDVPLITGNCALNTAVSRGTFSTGSDNTWSTAAPYFVVSQAGIYRYSFNATIQNAYSIGSNPVTVGVGIATATLAGEWTGFLGTFDYKFAPAANQPYYYTGSGLINCTAGQLIGLATTTNWSSTLVVTCQTGGINFSLELVRS
jgi:hypothetical protein